MSLLAFPLLFPYPKGEESDHTAVWVFGLTLAKSFHCCSGKSADKSKDAALPQQAPFIKLYPSTVYSSPPWCPVNEILIN